MNKYKKLRKLRDSKKELETKNIHVTYYELKKNYIDGIIKGVQINGVIYLYLDELIKYYKR